MKSYLLGIDIGTSGAKALLIDLDGAVVAKAVSDYPLSAPLPLWSEQDPADWWRATIDAVQSLLRAVPGAASGVAAVGLTGQMHGLVALDAAGEPVRPCILWNDQRTAEQCAEIAEIVGSDALVARTGKPVLPSFTAPKILWLREREPEAYARVAKILLPKDYIRHRMTGTYYTDVADASGTSLFDVGARRWSDDIVRALGVPASWLPETTESPEVSSYVGAAAARAIGIPAGTPVVAGAGDQAAEAVGCGVIAGGDVSVTVGTSGVVFAGVERYTPDPTGRVHAYCHAVPDTWHLMGVMLSAGGSLRWFRDTVAELERERAVDAGMDAYDYLVEHAALVPPGCEGLLFLPYLTGERCPHPDSRARGVFFGFTTRHTRRHFARAVLEGVTYGLRDSLELLRELAIPVDRVRVSGGGARSAFWRGLMADVFEAEVATVNVVEGAALGAALLAGVGAGAFATVHDAVRAAVRVTGTTAPAPNEAYRSAYARYRALYPALRPEFARIP